jgi:hypothetical protein
LTTRLEITIDILLQLFDVDLASFDLGMVEGHQEVSAVEAGDRGGLALPDQSLVIPLNGRSEPHVLGEFFWRAAQSGESIVRHLDCYRCHFTCLTGAMQAAS